MTPTGIWSVQRRRGFVEGTIAAALVVLWVLCWRSTSARPYMAADDGQVHPPPGRGPVVDHLHRLRDIFTVQVFLGSFIFFYPDVVKAQDLPITGGLAARLRVRGRCSSSSCARATPTGAATVQVRSCSRSGPRSTSCRTSSASQITGSHGPPDRASIMLLVSSSKNPDLALAALLPLRRARRHPRARRRRLQPAPDHVRQPGRRPQSRSRPDERTPHCRRSRQRAHPRRGRAGWSSRWPRSCRSSGPSPWSCTSPGRTSSGSSGG